MSNFLPFLDSQFRTPVVDVVKFPTQKPFDIFHMSKFETH